MKATRVLAASVIAGSLLFAGTACGNNEPDPVSSPSVSASAAPSVSASASPSASPDATASESATGKDTALIGPTAEPSEETVAPETPITESADSKAVSETVNAYYAFLLSPEAKTSVTQLTEKFGGAEPTDEQIQSVVAEHPEIYKYYDTSSVENIKNATQEFVMAASFGSMGDSTMEFKAPAEAVTVNGDTAELDTAAVIVIVNGEKIESQPGTGEQKVTFTKKDGKWVMVAKPFPTGSDTGTAPQ